MGIIQGLRKHGAGTYRQEMAGRPA